MMNNYLIRPIDSVNYFFREKLNSLFDTAKRKIYIIASSIFATYHAHSSLSKASLRPRRILVPYSILESKDQRSLYIKYGRKITREKAKQRKCFNHITYLESKECFNRIIYLELKGCFNRIIYSELKDSDSHTARNGLHNLVNLKFLKSLTLFNFKITDAVFISLARLPFLQSVKLSQCDITSQQTVNFVYLKSLIVDECKGFGPKAGRFHCLTSLIVKKPKICE